MRTRFYSGLLLVVVLLIPSCSKSFQAPFRLGINSWPGYAPLYIAKQNGQYAGQGINIIELPSTTEVIHALAMDNLEAAALTLDEALTVIDLGIDIQIILILDTSNGADALVSKPNINALSELAGKTLAVERSAVGAFMLDQALSSVNISTNDINVVNCAFDQHSVCFESVDAIVTFEPTVSYLVERGANILFDSAQIPNTVIDVIAVKRKVVEHQPDTILSLIEGYYHAREFMQQEPDLTRRYVSKFLRIDLSSVDGTLDKIYMPTQSEVETLMSGEPSQLMLSARRLEALMKSNDLLSNYQEPEHLTTNEFITP